jgi:hypothetical protein
MWVWVYSRSHPFSYPAWCIQLYCGRSTCGCLAVYFPGIKVGKMYLFLFFLFECLVVLVINRDIVRSTITPELDAVNWNSFSWGFCLPTNWVRVHLGVFVYPVSKSSLNFSIAERLQVRPSFVPYNFVCGFTSNLKYKHFWTLNIPASFQQKATRTNFFFQEKPASFIQQILFEELSSMTVKEIRCTTLTSLFFPGYFVRLRKIASVSHNFFYSFDVINIHCLTSHLCVSRWGARQKQLSGSSLNAISQPRVFPVTLIVNLPHTLTPTLLPYFELTLFVHIVSPLLRRNCSR